MDVGFSSNAATNAYGSVSNRDNQSARTSRTSNSRTEQANKFLNATKSAGVTKSDTYGSVIGQPELSEKAAKYYDSLKEKFGDAEFVLVANDSLDGAEAKAAQMNAAGKTIVLIDAEKIERMAEDESYRKQVEGTISTGKNQLEEMAKKMSGMSGVSGFGMRINDDGKASFFAVSAKNNNAVHEKMAEKREAKKTEAKKAAKKAEKRRAEEKIKDKREAKRAEEKELKEKQLSDDDEFEIIEADSIEELMNKLSDRAFNLRSDSVMTPAEEAVGGSIDFSA